MYNEAVVIQKQADGNFNPKNFEVAGFVRRMKKVTKLSHILLYTFLQYVY